jgi:transposase-like protein
VETTEQIVDLDEVTMQAWKTKGIEATRRDVEEKLIQARARRIGEFRAKGRKAYAWGYLTRKTLLTPVGNLGPIRIPRIRLDGTEIRLVPRQVRRIRHFNLMSAEATLGGISQRRMSGWLLRGNGQRISAATVGRVVQELAQEVKWQRSSALRSEEFAAVAVDGIFGRYRNGGDAVLAVAMGVRRDGSFDALDWESGHSESAELLSRLLTRLNQRGLRDIRTIVGDGAGALQAARQMVYPQADFQLCLWHLGRTLRRGLALENQERFRRDYWEVYNGLDRREVRRRARRFIRRYEPICPHAIETYQTHFEHTMAYLQFPAQWRHRVRTVNLAEGFFRNFRRFFNRFPGFQDEEHLSRSMGVYMLGLKPERWHSSRMLRVA